LRLGRTTVRQAHGHHRDGQPEECHEPVITGLKTPDS
jgi:hypothetical protein